jgi:hypothetical protein
MREKYMKEREKRRLIHRTSFKTAIIFWRALYRLIDIASSCTSDGYISPPRQVTPQKVFLSPSSGNKRTGAVFEADDSE